MPGSARTWGLEVAALVLIVIVLAAAVFAHERAESGTRHSNALWHVVHDLCVTDMKISGAPAPCLAVNLGQGWAALKDLRGATQILVIPTAKVAGIESPALLQPNAPNYWQDAWDARTLFEKRVGHPVPRDDIALAINSRFGRSQNQLHIHVDCVRADVRQALQDHQGRIGRRWRDLDFVLFGHRYRVMRIDGAEIAPRDPFKILARGDPRARADMGRETLMVVGAVFADGAPGFYLLSDHADLIRLDKAAGEDIEDHACKVLSAAVPEAPAK